MSIGFLVEEDHRDDLARADGDVGDHADAARRGMGRRSIFLVVDMPPGTGDAQLTMAQNVPLAGAVIVSTPQDLALIDARRGVAMFEKVNVPVLGLIENMSYFLCPHCGTRTEIFAHGGARQEAQKMGARFLGEIPLDMQIRETSDAGKPIVASFPDSPHAQAYRSVAAQLVATLESSESSRVSPKIVID